jgi:hypothetical protein
MRKHLKLRLQPFIKGAFALLVLLAFSKCSYDPEISKKPISLSFSTDTIQFDTLFAGKQSITKRLKVYNPSAEAVLLNDIRLMNATNNFELIVNGVSGNNFKDKLLLAEDSLLILIEANINQSDLNNPFVIREVLSFSNQGTDQSIVIEAWGQNAHYLHDSIIGCDAIWTADRPYVLSNSILVEEGCTLTIEAGTKIYSGEDSFILINGSLKVNGSADSLVLFTNDRLDEPFASAPGQWGGIIILEGSTDNVVQYADIKNSIVGFNVTSYAADGQVDLSLSNCKVGNTTNSAILALNSDVNAINSLFYNTASGTATHIGGGTANYTHCTIANYFQSPKEAPALYVSDYAVDNDDNEIIAPMIVNLLNTIVYGRLTEELIIFENAADNVDFSFSNCMFKTQQAALEANNSFINTDPLFTDPFDGNFQLTEFSPAISRALPTSLLIDIDGSPRDAQPDIGAYEFSAEPNGRE